MSNNAISVGPVKDVLLACTGILNSPSVDRQMANGVKVVSVARGGLQGPRVSGRFNDE